MTPSDAHLLPMVTPDLELQGSSAAGWHISQIGPKLTTLFPVKFDVENAPVEEVFPDAYPPLESLAEDVCSQGAALRNVAIRLANDENFHFSAHVVCVERTYGAAQLLVQFYLQKPLVTNAGSERFHDLVGSSSAMQDVYRKIRLYGASDAAVVITGETGTGKELVARAIHAESRRHDRPYVALNCSAIAEDLLESELFGHEKGAFTGAIRSHRGRFERANSGSLFLDEIGDMPLHTQTRLLRVLEERCVEPLGSEKLLPVDVRIICATNVGLEQAVGQGRFRSDLYHRISVLRIHLPPLRERLDDVPLLVTAFLDQLSRRYQRRIEKLTPEAMSLLQSYLWPGNIRELRNVMERIFVENHAPVIGSRAFTEWIRERQSFSVPRWEDRSAPEAPPLIPPYPPLSDEPDSKGPLTEEQIRRAYHQSHGNLSAAARALGVHRATLYRYLKRLDLDRSSL